ncbi:MULTISPECIES: glycosyltransferase family 39 protein [Rhodococcus]|uniref:Glycosyltransferase family 39 protein n=1 Tax=Rhodococcus cercidiphylli TaxID=489916 RepID=A0ABU4AYG2_9NOCA|nr:MULTISPECIES: glycosyltransferase family 39 protein [Rhodococcus]MDI9927631.1 glycosyltransferase family 39 protein [Rhodococcus sp. IEGM 1341]MDV6231287.1 glycosyltransferase family 39 protein [Rhodococcus cercidiphylli]
MTAQLDRPAAMPPSHARQPSWQNTWWYRRRHLLGLLILLAATATLYLWNLTASGYANTFYAAAVQAGTKDWTAWFFGSLDSENFITVDKPPASLWVMGLSARLFGFSSFGLLLPQALMGVASVATVYAAVKRVANPMAGLLAGFTLASVPAAALMFNFDNPDALLVLLMTLGGYFVVRSLQTAAGRRAAMWLAFAGVALGFAFLTKMLQGLLVLPAFGLTYLVAGQAQLRARLLHLVGASAALVVAAGWLVTVQLWPESARPYIGGSTDNTVMDLVLGYNGLGRIFGNSGGGGMEAPAGMSAGAAGSSFGGSTGLDRLFGSEMGIQISWLIPTALVALVFGLIARGRAPRTDLLRASLILWGGWFLVTALIFSYMSGTIHPYYTVALAPALAGMIGTGGYALWLRRESIWGRAGMASMMIAAGVWSWVLLHRNADWLPALKWILLVGTIVAAVMILAAGRYRRLTAAALILGAVAGLGGGASYAIATTTNAHSGSVPTAGPTGAVSDGGPGGMPGGGMPSGGMPSGGMPIDAMPSDAMPSGDAGLPADAADLPAGFAGGNVGGGMAMGGMGGESNEELAALLESTTTKWSAAVNGSMSAAGYELASDTAVMAIGGWSGDPAPSLDEFIQYVADHEVTYYVSGGMGGGMARGGLGGDSESTSSQIQEWVEANFTATTVGSATVYDLSTYTG